jgi:hypothetical protein
VAILQMPALVCARPRSRPPARIRARACPRLHAPALVCAASPHPLVSSSAPTLVVGRNSLTRGNNDDTMPSSSSFMTLACACLVHRVVVVVCSVRLHASSAAAVERGVGNSPSFAPTRMSSPPLVSDLALARTLIHAVVPTLVCIVVHAPVCAVITALVHARCLHLIRTPVRALVSDVARACICAVVPVFAASFLTSFASSHILHCLSRSC